MKINIRKAKEEDLKIVVELIKEGFSKTPFNEKYSLKEILMNLKFNYKKGQIYLQQTIMIKSSLN